MTREAELTSSREGLLKHGAATLSRESLGDYSSGSDLDLDELEAQDGQTSPRPRGGWTPLKREEECQGQSKGSPDPPQGKQERWMVSEQDMPVNQYHIARRFINFGGRLLSVFLQEDSTCGWTITALVSFTKRRDCLAVANELSISGNAGVKDVPG